MSFRDDFLRTPGGPLREELVYRTIIEQGKPTDLAPVTVDGPEGTKITYYVTKDFLNTDGVWLPMTGVTAQMVADHFGMYLPTPKMSRQIYAAAGTKIMPAPLSGTGYGQYSAQQVVQSRISASDAALAYSQRIADAQKGHTDGIVAGHMKDITQPPPSGNLGLYGWYGRDGRPVQNSHYTPHDIFQHTEYGSGVRLIDKRVTIAYPDGRREETTMDKILNGPLHSAVSDTAGVAKYDTNKDKAGLAKLDTKAPQSKTPQPKEQSGPSPEQMNQLLNSIMTELAGARDILEKRAEGLDLSKAILPSEYGYQPGVPPPGYGAASFRGRAPKPIEDVAKQVLHTFFADRANHPIGTMVPFTVDGKQYMARAEVHSNAPYGISVYESKSGTQGRMRLLDRVTQNAPDEHEQQMQQLLLELSKEL